MIKLSINEKTLLRRLSKNNKYKNKSLTAFDNYYIIYQAVVQSIYTLKLVLDGTIDTTILYYSLLNFEHPYHKISL